MVRGNFDESTCIDVSRGTLSDILQIATSSINFCIRSQTGRVDVKFTEISGYDVFSASVLDAPRGPRV